MNSGMQPQGFTIIEVLIVLSLATFMFAATAISMNSNQKQTEFDTGARQIYTQLQSLSTDVQNGLYPNSSISCSYNFNNPSPIPGTYPSFTAAAPKQGANLGCVYVGKAIQFNPGGANAPYFNVYSLVGVQYIDSSLDLPGSFPAYATVLDTTHGSTYGSAPGGTQVVSLPDQFTVNKINYPNNPLGGLGGDIFGFYSIQTSNLSSSSALSDQLFILPTSGLSISEAITSLNSDTAAPGQIDQYDISPSSPLTVCFTSPLETNQAVKIVFENQSNTANLVLSYDYNYRVDGC